MATGASDNIVVTFETPDLAAAIEQMAPPKIDALPFGVIGLNARGEVRVFNATEARLSGYGSRPALGQPFFAKIAPCMNTPLFKGRIEQARASGKLNIRFQFTGDFSDRYRRLSVRVQAASDCGMWIFCCRDAGSMPEASSAGSTATPDC